MGATEKIASFVVDANYEDIPHEAIEKAKRTALDCLAAALAGCREPCSEAVVSYVRKLEGPPHASIIGAGFRASVPEAALANGTIAHAQDYDDCGMKILHPSVMVLPAVLSLGERLGASGRDVLAAYILGLEVQGKVALYSDSKPDHTLFAMAWYGCLGATVAAGKLLHLDVSQARRALGIAAHLASGLFANHGTMVFPMSAGNACRTGIVAALLARESMTANPSIIEADNGFCHTVSGRDACDAEAVVQSLGNPFYIISPGIGLKKYPSCYHTHRALDALFQIMAERHLTYEDVDEVEVGTSEVALRILRYPQPTTGFQGKFSMPHVIGCALLDGKVTLATFTEEKVRDPKVQEARKKVRTSLPDLPIWPGLDAQGPDTVFVGNPVTIRTRQGSSYSARVDVPRGDPAQPLSDGELLAKFEECARPLMRPGDIRHCSDLVLGLEEVANIRELMDIIVAPAPGAQ